MSIYALAPLCTSALLNIMLSNHILNFNLQNGTSITMHIIVQIWPVIHTYINIICSLQFVSTNAFYILHKYY